MQIAKDMVVTLNYTLKDNDGNLLDESKDGEFVYLHGASNIIPGLEKELDGKTAGENLNVNIAPEDAYGVRDDALRKSVARTAFDQPDEIEVGKQFHAQSNDGRMMVITVVEVEGDSVTIDGNHPLAGIPLNFDVAIVDVRPASKEELEHGHVHGPGGHQH